MRNLLLVATLLGVGYLVGCGNSGSNSSTATCPAGYINSNNTCVVSSYSTTSCQGTCAVGQVQTAQGCLTQWTGTACGVCSGQSAANTCVAGTVTSTGTNGYTLTNGQCISTTTGQQAPVSYCTTGTYGTTGYGTNGTYAAPGYAPSGYPVSGWNTGYQGGGYYPGYYPGYAPAYYPGYYGYGYNYWGH